MASGTSRVTTLPAPMTAPEPIRTPARIIAPPPTQTSDPISIALPNSFSTPLLGIERVQRRIDLHRRSEQSEIADPHRADIQDDAVEVEEDAFAELDVRAVVAIERGLHPDALAALAEQVAQDATTFRFFGLARGVELLTEIACTRASCDQLRIERVVHLTCQHLLAFSRHA
jgi:hypothetical protein